MTEDDIKPHGDVSTARQRVDISERLVECWIEDESPGQRWETPWGVIDLAELSGGGQILAIEATADFDLALHRGATSFYEHLTPGKHRLLLTVLDRTDVMVR